METFITESTLPVLRHWPRFMGSSCSAHTSAPAFAPQPVLGTETGSVGSVGIDDLPSFGPPLHPDAIRMVRLFATTQRDWAEVCAKLEAVATTTSFNPVYDRTLVELLAACRSHRPFIPFFGTEDATEEALLARHPFIREFIVQQMIEILARVQPFMANVKAFQVDLEKAVTELKARRETATC
jgi:hypothetical protein